MPLTGERLDIFRNARRDAEIIDGVLFAEMAKVIALPPNVFLMFKVHLQISLVSCASTLLFELVYTYGLL